MPLVEKRNSGSTGCFDHHPCFHDTTRMRLMYDKTWNIYRVYYLLQQDDDMVHCVTIRMRENYAKKNPGKIEEIKRILDSFTIKGER